MHLGICYIYMEVFELKGGLRKIVVVFIIGIIILIGLGIWVISGRIVSVSEDSSRLLEEETDEVETEESSVLNIDEKVFIEGTEENGFARVSGLFSGVDLDARQKRFLGSNYERYVGVLDTISEEYIEVFSEILDIKSDPDLTDVRVLEKDRVNLFDKETWEDTRCVYCEKGMTIVGLYGTHCVVYKYQYVPDDEGDLNFVVVDYTNAMLSMKNRVLFGFGQNKTVLMDPGYVKLVEGEGYSLLYVKEY